MDNKFSRAFEKQEGIREQKREDNSREAEITDLSSSHEKALDALGNFDWVAESHEEDLTEEGSYKFESVTVETYHPLSKFLSLVDPVLLKDEAFWVGFLKDEHIRSHIVNALFYDRSIAYELYQLVPENVKADPNNLEALLGFFDAEGLIKKDIERASESPEARQRVEREFARYRDEKQKTENPEYFSRNQVFVDLYARAQKKRGLGTAA